MLRLFAALSVLALGGLPPSGEAPRRPVIDADFPDPFVVATDKGLVAYATNSRRRGRLVNVQMSQSADGRSWSAPQDAMPEAPAWAKRGQPDIWAPEVLRIGERYVMYFSARHATQTRPDGLTLCVGAAVAETAQGPFIAQSEPLTCGGALGVIDANPFRDGDDLWLYVKTDGNCCRVPTTLVAQRLSPDGLSLSGQPSVVQGFTNDAGWEGGVVEAPQMVVHDGRYHLFYSANDFGGRAYATGYAACESPAGPCRDASANPILASTSGLRGLVGPGHPGLFEYGGQTLIAYHGWRRPLTDGRWGHRALYIDRIEWTPAGPVVVPLE